MVDCLGLWLRNHFSGTWKVLEWGGTHTQLSAWHTLSQKSPGGARLWLCDDLERRGGRLSREGISVYPQAVLVAQMVKNLPAMQGTWIRPMGLKDPLEKDMATHSSILAWRIQWIEETGGL